MSCQERRKKSNDKNFSGRQESSESTACEHLRSDQCKRRGTHSTVASQPEGNTSGGQYNIKWLTEVAEPLLKNETNSR